jgi:hypothetical protein
MHPVRIVFAICVSLSLWVPAFSESFEGFLGGFPIWMDLSLPAGDGPARASYFYKKVGAPILLEGERSGGKLILREKDAKGRVTGVFECSWQEKDLAGDWEKPGAKKRLPVRLARTDTAYKAHAVHRFADLKLLEEGNLAKAIGSWDGEGSDGPAEVTYLYDRRNILSVEVSWSGMGAYPVSGSDRYLFDLKRRKQVSIWDEIDAAGLKRIWKVLGPKLDAELKEGRRGFSDSEWVEALAKPDEAENWDEPGKKLDGIFSASHTMPAPGAFSDCYLDSADFHFHTSNWFGFPHVIQNMDVTVEIPMPLAELATYLKPGSFLRALVREP